MTDFGTPAKIQNSLEQKIQTFVDAVVFNSSAETYTATGIDVSKYRKFSLLIDLAVVSDPTDIQIQVRFSDDNVVYRRLMDGPFGDLRYEDSAGAKAEAINGAVSAAYMDIHVVSSGCEAGKTFTLTVKVVLSNQ